MILQGTQRLMNWLISQVLQSYLFLDFLVSDWKIFLKHFYEFQYFEINFDYQYFVRLFQGSKDCCLTGLIRVDRRFNQ